MFGKDKIVQLFNKKRVELSMSKGFALFNEGLYLYQEEKYDLAFEKFKQAEKLGYKSCDMYLCMSYVCDINEQRNVDLVLKYLDKAIKCDSDYGYAYFLKGATYSEYCDKYDLAIEYLLKAKKHDYESASLYYYLAKCYDNLDETMKALAAASTCISKYPDSYSGYMAKGNIYYYQNRYKEALPYLLKSEELGEVETSILFKISYSYSTLEDYKKALEYANKMIFLDKKNPVAYYRKGFVYYNQKDIEPALKNFLEAEKLGLDQNDWGGMYSRMSWIYQSKNDNEKALYYSNKALSYDIKDSFDYYRMGCLQMYGLENNTEALKYFKLALKHAEDDEAGQIDVYIDLSVLYMKLRKYTLALKTVNEGLEFPSKFNNEFLYRQKIAVLYKMNRFKECQKIVDYLLGIEANDFWALQACGMLKFEEKDYDTDIECFIKSEKELKEINPWAYAYWSFALLNKGKYDESLEKFSLYSEYEDLKYLEYKDKILIKSHINKLEKYFPNNPDLEKIKEKFAKIINV